MAKNGKVDTNKVLNFSIFLAVVVILLVCLAFVIYLINIPAPDITKSDPDNEENIPDPAQDESQPEEEQPEPVSENTTENIIIYKI